MKSSAAIIWLSPDFCVRRVVIKTEIENKYKIGEKIKLARVNSGWSQVDMAKFLCVDQRTISQWELGNLVPSGRKMLLIMEKLKINFMEL